MTADVSIFEVIKDEYVNTYFNKLPQSVKLDEATPKILIKNISQTKADDKDKAGRYEVIYRIEIIGSVYRTCKDTGADITNILENFTDESIYLVSYDVEFYDTNETAEIHRVIIDFKAFINR
jgi:hypothetical protein